MPALLDVTEKAAAQARKLLAQRGLAEGGVRVRVTPGGCSGFSYDLQPAAGPAEGDLSVDALGLRLYVERASALYLAGTVLDYESTLMSQRFVFRNPNAAESCSCGDSFALKDSPAEGTIQPQRVSCDKAPR